VSGAGSPAPDVWSACGSRKNMSMRWLIPIALLGVLLVVSASSATTPLLNVKGTLVRSGATSDCYPGEPCDPLPPALYVVFSRAGKLTRARLGSTGSFALHLAP